MKWTHSVTFARPAIISAVLVLPFVLLELLNKGGPHENFPIVLFVFMWLLAFSFFVLLMPLVRRLRAEKSMNHLIVWPRVVLVILIAWMWVGLVVDQMPCFLGVPNCD